MYGGPVWRHWYIDSDVGMRVLLHLLFISCYDGTTIFDVLRWTTTATANLPLQMELETTASANATTSKEAHRAGSINPGPESLLFTQIVGRLRSSRWYVSNYRGHMP